jgi:predicted membrane channel-forming protein YqfA (hemolysin III family)
LSPLIATSFLDVVWWMILLVFFTLFVWMFISVFADIFSRTDLSGLAKALWILLIFVLPLLGILIYLILRPAPSEQEMQALFQQQRRTAGVSATEEISRAHELLNAGAISQTEFDQIKARALT